VRIGVLKISLVAIVVAFVCFACGDEPKKEVQKPSKKVKQAPIVKRPDFNADSAYAFVQKQVDFGPRVPNTEAHQQAGKYLSSKLKSYGFEVINQKTKVTAYNNKSLNINNIIGEYNPGLNNRVLLFAHWDSRHIADQDKERKKEAILGANDGGSGVGVLLEIARQIEKAQPKIGVDIILFDGEDYGQPSTSDNLKSGTWCLGSQYWGNNPHRPNYSANYGILLDMVGAKDAYFTKERISMAYAPQIVEKVWAIASALGHQNHFVFNETMHVGEDDHYYVNKLTGIPSIDIIQYDPQTKAFAPHWHTHDDNMEVIDKNTLAAVGETVLATVLQEAKLLQ